MNLVAYSDSEASNDSDDEQQLEGSLGKAPNTEKSATAPSKSSFQKVVDRSNPHKIKVNLPAASSSVAIEAQEDDARPAKKARIGGGGGGGSGGRFSELSAFLPAPKRSGETATGSESRSAAGGSRGLGRGLGRGVNLRTGAVPAFSRDVPLRTEDYSMSTERREEGAGVMKDARLITSDTIAEPEIKFVGKATVFKPLSVARGTGKKTKKKNIVSSSIIAKGAQTTSSGAPSVAAPPPKPKVSLFSILNNADTPQESYPPEPTIDLAEEDAVGDDNSEQDIQPHQYELTEAQPSSSSVAAQSLDSLATSLDLDAATRRQLFGRNSKSGATPINLVNFNTDQEYAANEERRAAGETIQHNAVRTIAPGKHSLKQLVNAASSQRDALEESWAAGRRNKRDAGARYGW
jgi:Mitotic checkpoint regulator, MAD2B-interacting